MEKLDLTKQHKTYFTAKRNPEIIEIESAQFVSLIGKGDPSGENFSEKVQALYATTYTLKFMYKEQHKDFVVSKLEGLWWFDQKKHRDVSMVEAPEKIPRSEWEYRLLIRLPEFVIKADVQKAREATAIKKELPVAGEIDLYQMNEGKCVQALHTGPFSTEPDTLQLINEFISVNNLKQNGFHHEIYLSDFRKTAPEMLRTILREPVK